MCVPEARSYPLKWILVRRLRLLFSPYNGRQPLCEWQSSISVCVLAPHVLNVVFYSSQFPLTPNPKAIQRRKFELIRCVSGCFFFFSFLRMSQGISMWRCVRAIEKIKMTSKIDGATTHRSQHCAELKMKTVMTRNQLEWRQTTNTATINCHCKGDKCDKAICTLYRMIHFVPFYWDKLTQNAIWAMP